MIGTVVEREILYAQPWESDRMFKIRERHRHVDRWQIRYTDTIEGMEEIRLDA